MGNKREMDPPLWINDKDKQERPIDRRVIEAAHRIWKRVIQFVRREGHEVADAAETLELAALSVSRAMDRNAEDEPIRSIDSYLFWSFVRRFRSQLSKQGRIQYVESAEVLESLKSERENGVTSLHNEILLKQLIAQMDMKTRRMLVRRVFGYSWAEIGEEFRISAHNAEAQFSYGLKRARERLLGQRPRLDPEEGGKI